MPWEAGFALGFEVSAGEEGLPDRSTEQAPYSREHGFVRWPMK